MDDDAKSARFMEAARHAHANYLAQFKTYDDARIADARMAIQALLLINGGSATAILAFAGSVATKTATGHVPKLFSWSLGVFAFGVACAGTTAMLAYFANHALAEAIVEHEVNYIAPFVHAKAQYPARSRTANLIRYTAIGTALLALAAFVGGAVTAAAGLGHIR